jgi:hypothetical protein
MKDILKNFHILDFLLILDYQPKYITFNILFNNEIIYPNFIYLFFSPTEALTKIKLKTYHQLNQIYLKNWYDFDNFQK